MDRSYVRLARSVSHASLSFAGLYGVLERTASGQGDILRSIPQIIGYLISLGATIYTVVTAEKARAIAHAVANAVSSLGIAVPIMIAAAAAATAGIIALMGSRQLGGPIYREGAYYLHPGEEVIRGGASRVNVYVTGNTITADTMPIIGRQLVSDLRSAGVM